MNPILRNILSVIAGWLAGSIVMMGIIQIGYQILPIEGVDPNDMDALAAVMPTLDAQFFISPFLAHALGALVGAMVAGLVAATHKMKFSIAIGILFLAGGIWMSVVLPAPATFTAIDLFLAYIPMAWIGGKVAQRKSNRG